MYKSLFVSKHLVGNCVLLSKLVKSCKFNLADANSSCIVGVINTNNSYSSLAKSKQTTNLIKKDVSPQARMFSFKESFDYALLTHSALFKLITESTPVAYAQSFIIGFHDYSGLPWWLSIICTTFIVRGLTTFPIALYQNYVIAKLENAKKEMDNIVNDIKYDLNRDVRTNKWSEKQARRIFKRMVRKEWNQLIVRENCHPAKIAILALFQVPIWITFSTAFRNLVYKLPYNDTFAELKCLELSVGGIAWFPNLLVADSFVLPITLGLVNLTIIEIQTMMHIEQRSRIQRYATNFFRGVSIFMIPLASVVPSCLSLYWVTSSTIGLCQNLVLLSPKLRRLIGIPSTSSTNQNPYAHLRNQIRNKFGRS